jgi:hypothetical protein
VHGFAFVDLASARAEPGCPLRGDLAARPFGYSYATGDWTGVADGILYTEEMIPSARIESQK